jgi:GAF domain-containing protein/two-component sensor histidine kinase
VTVSLDAKDAHAFALENHRLVEATERGAMELVALNETAQALTSTLHLPEVLEAIADRALTLIGAHHCAVFELDPLDGCLHLRAIRGMSPNEAVAAIPLGQGAAGTAALRRQVIFSPDVEAQPLPKYDELWPGAGLTMAESARQSGVRAVLSVPLASRETVLGAVCLYWDQPHAYDEREVRLLTSLAQYAAIAIDNARLYADMAEQRREAELLSEITRNLASSLDLASVLRKIIEYAKERCGSDMAFIAPYVPARQVATIVASVGTRTDVYIGVAIRPGKGIGGRVLETKQPFITSDYLNDPRLNHEYNPLAEQEGFVANMAVPILREGEILGVLWVVNRSPRPFTARHQAVLTKLAGQAAIAVQNARLFEETQRRLGETAALLKIAEILNSELDLEPVLKEIARRTAEVLGFDRCSVFLWSDGRVQPVMSQFADGRAAPELWAAFKSIAQYPIEEIPALTEAIRSAAPVVVPDARVSPLVPDWWVEAFAVKSVLVLPLVRQGTVIGALHLDRSDSTPVEEQQLALAMTIAAQVALAVDMARHYTEERAQAAGLAAQVEITRAATSTLELKPLLKQIAQHTARALGMGRCSIYLWREGHLMPVMSQFADGHFDPQLWARFKAFRGQPMEEVPAYAQALRLKQPVLVEDARNSDLLAPDWVEVFGIRAALVVPLIAKDEVIGTLSLQDVRQPRHWSTAQVDLAMTIAAQVALAVENARLYDESQRARADLQGKNAELDTFVYSVSHDLKAPLVTIQGMAGLLLEEYRSQLPEEAARYLGRIQANAQQMEHLILDLLALSRIGREARAATAVSLAEVVDDVVADLAGSIHERGIQLVRGELPTIWGVRTQVEQVMRNLVGNAVKYLGDTSQGRVAVEAMDRGAFVECYVRDNGIGIDPAYHERIFEVFQRLKEVDVEGTGVGLAIVTKIVQASGGRIWLESAKGQGATFHFTWPKGPAREPQS